MRHFFHQMFSESGEASFSRVGTFLVLACACVWVTRIVWATNALPSLDGLTLFISTLYALGKAGQTVQKVFGDKKE